MLGIGATLAIKLKSTAEKDGDARFAEYEKGEKSQTWLREKIHEDIEDPDTIESYVNLDYLYERMKNDELRIMCYKNN